MSWDERIRVAVVGAGGLGSKFGGLLALNKNIEVWLIDINKEHIQAVRDHGLTLIRDNEEQVIQINATTDPGVVGLVDLLIVMVKAYDTVEAATSASQLLHSESLAVTFQNGLGNIEALSSQFGEERCVLGVTFQGATLLGPGRAADMGGGPTYIATNQKTDSRLSRIVEAYSNTTIQIELRAEEEVDGMLWGKLAMVTGINPIATILRVPNGALGEVEQAKDLSFSAIKETMAVASAKGIKLAYNPLERFEATTRATSKMLSGTLIDALRGYKTEIDAISGAIAEEGSILGVPTPVNRMLYRIVKAIEATHDYRVDLPRK